MHRFLFCFLALCCLVGCGSKLDKNSAAGLLSSEAAFDLGEIRQFESKSHVFELTNASHEDIAIKQIAGGCGCTTFQIDRSTIHHGQKAKLKATLSITDRSGSIATHFIVTWESNKGDARGIREFVLRATALPVAIFEPHSINMQFIQPNALPQTALLRVRRGNSELPWESIEASDGSQNLQATQVDASTFDVHFAFDPAGKAIGIYHSEISVKLMHENKALQHIYKIPVVSKIEADIEASPGVIYMGRMFPRSTKVGFLKIRTKSGKPVDFVSMDTPSRNMLHPELKKSGNGSELLLSYTFHAPQTEGIVSSKLFVKVRSLDREYELSIPYMAYIASLQETNPKSTGRETSNNGNPD